MSKKLKYFVTAFEAKCINNAADLLYITRSPLIRVLCELEEKTGERLFIRKYNQLNPTDRAQALYEKIKPIYDLLQCIENEFMNGGRTSGFELLCDFSVPYVIYQHICFRLKELPQAVSCRRVCVSSSEIQSLTANPDIALYSFRKLHMPEYLICHGYREESLFLLLPESILESDLKDFNKMKNMKLYIRKDTLSVEMKGYISKALMDFIPNVEIHETEYDTASLLIYVSTGKGMMLLPESLAIYFSPPCTQRIKVPNVSLKSGLYVNKRNKKTKIIGFISGILTTITA